MTDNREIKTAALIYGDMNEYRQLLPEFATHMTKRGWRVGGLLQEKVFDSSGAYLGVDAVAIGTQDRYPIVRPSKEDRLHGNCGLDRTSLTESSQILQRSIQENVDLLIVEKFGERERSGSGLADEILMAISQGIPTIVAVPGHAVSQWHNFTGGFSDYLPCSFDALQGWWDKENIYQELISEIQNEKVLAVTIGRNWTMVESETGCGLAHTPAREASGCKPIAEAGKLTELSLRQLAEKAFSWNPVECAIGMAAINAWHNKKELTGASTNGLDLINPNDKIAFVGAFKGAKEKLPSAKIIELSPKDDQYPASATTSILKTSETVVITASSFVNRTLPDLLSSTNHSTNLIVGPGTPLSKTLFNYGVDVLSGLVVEDREKVRAIVAAGGSIREIKPWCRYVTLQAPHI